MKELYSRRLHKGVIRLNQQKWLLGMIIPGFIWLVVFCYIPMYGIVIAFMDYRPSPSLFSGALVGFKHFRAIFHDPFGIEAIVNTLIISSIKLVCLFPAPIIFALLLNEMRAQQFKKFVQSVSYLPFFISWVVMVGLLNTLLAMEGPVNTFLLNQGFIDRRIAILTIPGYFRPIAVLSDLWKGVGWGSILYLAAIASIPQDMYESAYIDGTNRLQRIIHITLPSMMPTVTIMLIFSVAGILGSNFDQHFLMNNAQISHVATTIDVYVFGVGLQTGRYSYATAINLTRSVIGFFLLFGADRFARYISDGEQGLF